MQIATANRWNRVLSVHRTVKSMSTSGIWNIKNFFIKLEQELKQNNSLNVSFGIPTIGGM